jgi:hypothetical protein
MATESLQSHEEINNHEDLPDDLQKILIELMKKCEEEDSWVRKQQIKMWKKNDEFWHGVQFIFWSESRQDWIAPQEIKWFVQEEGREEAEGPFYDFVINIYKAHGESIIAALSTEVPAVRFPPDDAEDQEDLTTSKTYAKIADLIQKHNKAKMLLVKALFLMWNEGLVFAYHAPKADKAYGILAVPKFEDGLTCPNCGPMPEGKEFKESEQDEVIPEPPSLENNSPGAAGSGTQFISQQGSLTQDQDLTDPTKCPICGASLTKTPVLSGVSESPKSRINIELYGPLHVQVPYNSMEQKDFGYLILRKDLPLAYLKSLYPHVSDDIDHDVDEKSQAERIARTPSAFSSFSRVDENRTLRSLKRCWMRPWMFDAISDVHKTEREKLKKMFPRGCYMCYIGNNVYVEARDEDLDKYWTVGKIGLSKYIHCDPLGQPLISVQEIRNVLVNLTQETVEHGIPNTFADPEVLDFDSYSRHEARPGMVYPATPKPGQTIANAFWESTRATLSRETMAAFKQYDQDGQFVVGSYPSIYGGPSQGKTRTASEYNMSRQMALQRLGIAWSLVVDWWAHMIEKCVHLFVETVISDQHYVAKENGNYVNVWIRQSEMSGKVGEVEYEGAEHFPITMAQKQHLFMELLQLNNEFIQTAMFDPENRRKIADVLGDPELFIPGEDQKIKQSREIQQMISGQQVMIEPAVDDDEIHIATLRNFMVGASGMDLKNTNPQAYQMLMMHLMQHQQSMMQKTMSNFEGSAVGENPDRGVEG